MRRRKQQGRSNFIREELLREAVTCGITCIDLSPIAVLRMRGRLAEHGTNDKFTDLVDSLFPSSVHAMLPIVTRLLIHQAPYCGYIVCSSHLPSYEKLRTESVNSSGQAATSDARIPCRWYTGIASVLDGGNGRVKEDAREGGSRGLTPLLATGGCPCAFTWSISINLKIVKEMSNDEYIHIPRDILKRVLAGDGTTANLGMLKNSDSAGGGWSRGSSCAGGSDGSTTSWLFVTSELEDVQGRDRSSPLSCGKEFSRERWQIFFPNGGGCMHMCILVAFLCLIHPFYIIN